MQDKGLQEHDGLNELSLFTGYAGFSLGLRLAGIRSRTVCYVEIEPYCQEIIKARIRDGYLDDAPIWPDVFTLPCADMAGVVDLVSAGFPCQPHSTAGKRLGAADKRDLWPVTAQVIGAVRPRYVCLENVPGLIVGDRPYVWRVLADLRQMGYVGRAGVVGARDAGATHRRYRWWCVAYSASNGRGEGWPQSAGQQGRHDAAECGNGSGVGDMGHTASTGRATPRGCPAERERRAWLYPTGTGQGTMGNALCSDVTGREPEPGRGQERGVAATGTGEVVGHGAWPPCPADTDAWARVLRDWPGLAPALPKSGLRGMAYGTARALGKPGATRRKELQALGNGICVPAAALALKWLLQEMP